MSTFDDILGAIIGLGTVYWLMTTKDKPDIPDIPNPEPGYTLVWSDEFNGSTLDTNKWLIKGNPNMNVVNNSYLHSKNKVIGGQSTSGWIKTKNPVFAQHGMVEIKIKYSQKSGINNQIWLSDPNWFSEIDFEYVPPTNAQKPCGTNVSGYKGWSLHSMYCDGYANQCSNWEHPVGQHWTGTIIPAVITDWVILKIIWTPTYLAYLANDVELRRINSPYNPTRPMAIHINCCGGYPGCECTVADAILKMNNTSPTEMLIDYVRVYKKNS